MNLVPSPSTVYSNPQSPSCLLFDPEKGKSFVYHIDGTIELIPNSPAYLVGEYILRPAIDNSVYYCHQTINIVRNGLNFLDSRISNLLSIFPGASAQQVVITNSEGSLSNSIIVRRQEGSACQIDFEAYLNRLSSDERIKMNRDPNFLIENFNKAVAIKSELKDFVREMAEKAKTYAESLFEFNQSYDDLYTKLDEILKDLQGKQSNSPYSPFKKGKLALKFPICQINKSPNDAKPSVVPISGWLSFDKKDLLEPKSFSYDKAKYGMIEVEKQVWNKIFEGSGLYLDLLYLDCDTSIESFKMLFSDTEIKALLAFLEKKKEIIQSWMQNQEKFLTDFVDQKRITTGYYVQLRIEEINGMQKNIIEESNRLDQTKYIIKENQNKGVLSEWKVVKPGGLFTSDEAFFHFYTTTKLKDEL